MHQPPALPDTTYFSRFDAAIFDLDGTLVHSEHVWDAAKLQVIADFGHNASLTQLRAHLGCGLSEFLDEVFGEPLTVELRTEIADKIGAVADQLLPKQRTPVAATADFLRDLHDNGLRIAICSSSPRRHIESAVDALKIREQVEVILSAADLSKGKPDLLS
ncbi:MAG: HAD family phosphatase [Rhodobacteraceae bacterium]|nr:HAD family phosphatase [Paracoccaceae bacterium]